MTEELIGMSDATLAHEPSLGSGPPLQMTSTVRSVPNPDPTQRTIDQLQREIASTREIVQAYGRGTREVIETRLFGMDKAIELLQRTTDKLPDQIRGEVKQLQQLHDEKFHSIGNALLAMATGIEKQFIERDKRTEQLSLADKTAIAAALQAQKEAAGAQNDSNSTANIKMEANFAKLIEQTQQLLQEVRRNTDDKINDVKSRLDKGEGNTRGMVESRLESRGHRDESRLNLGTVLGVGGLLVAAVMMVYTVSISNKSTSVDHYTPPGYQLVPSTK